MTSAALLRSFTVRGICGCYHISSSTYELVWISDDKNNLILTNNACKILHQVGDFYSNTNIGYGLHIVNNMSEMIYFDSFYNIKKITNNLKTSCVAETSSDNWRYHCLCWSPFSGDLLFVMYNAISNTGKLTRYDHTGQLTQTIQYHNTALSLYGRPFCVTENNNGNVIVSDLLRGVW